MTKNRKHKKYEEVDLELMGRKGIGRVTGSYKDKEYVKRPCYP